MPVNPIGLGYASVFLVTGLVCLGAVPRARTVGDEAVRRGLVGLLVTTGIWALLKSAFFVLPDPLREPSYIVGLAVGFSTVWAWLYFCSAYTGRDYHRNTTLRRLSAGVFLGVVAVKLTNPLHGLYFTATERTTPFVHLAIEHQSLHWAATGLSYALAATGLFMLFERYLESEYDTRPLAVLTVLIGVPVVFDMVALAVPQLIEAIYAPIGVAAFVVGVLFVFERRFLAAQYTGSDDDAMIVLDDDGRIRDYSAAATAAFPELEGANGERLSTALPSVAAVAESDEQLLERKEGTERRYYLVSNSSVTLGETTGRVLGITDVTQAERRRRELERHNDQLEGIAGALAHELRNMLQIIDGRLGIARRQLSAGTTERESVDAALEANDRLSELVEDFTTLTKHGQTVERLETVDFGAEIRGVWATEETADLRLTVDTDGSLEADPQRFRELVRDAIAFAQLNEAQTVTVALRENGFTITDDGRPPMDSVDRYFEFGESVPDAESGMKLPKLRSFVRVHGWRVDIDTEYRDGIRLVVSDVATTVAEPQPRDA
ncbi:hypothetical protein HTG_12780 [Natrinema mahii]|nr:hypothetical protein HTG_12780 [Natrinema mahii]